MKPSTFSLLPVLICAAACGGSGGGEGPVSTTGKGSTTIASMPSDGDILRLVYESEYHVPDGFFVDERTATTTASYTVHHVLDTTGSYELCSDDLVEAQAWEQADNDSRAVDGYYVTSYENDRYFEFVRELDYDQDIGNITAPTTPGYARVFKCAHTNRDGVDRALLDGYSGTLDTARVDSAMLRGFTEYMWQFRFFNVSRKLVLDSYGFESGPDVGHTLLLAFVINQGSDRCDRIDVIEWRFVAERASGEIMKSFETVHSFEASNDNATPAICN